MEKIQPKFRLRVGLVLGKFAPLHLGHQYLIETALRKSDRLYVVIYSCPEVIDIPLHKRADWIRKLYPKAIVLEAVDGPSVCGRSRSVKMIQENYLKKILPENITHFFSSEWYGTHVSKALGAKDIRVDMKREHIPISATIIRSDPHRYKNFLDPYVYKDFVKKVVLLGAESTGKTTLAKYTAKKLRTRHIVEYGREYWQNHHDKKGKLSAEQLLELAQIHLQKEEEALPNANKYLIVDTNALTTLRFHHFYHHCSHTALESIAREITDRYDYWFVCDTDIPFEQDGTRNDKNHRVIFQNQIIQDLKNRGIKYTLLSGNLATRHQQLLKSLA